MSITEETFYSTVDTGDLFLSGNSDSNYTWFQLLTSKSANKVFHVGIFIKLEEMYILELSVPTGLKLTPLKRFKKKYVENVYVRYTKFTTEEKEKLKKYINTIPNLYSISDVSHIYLQRVIGNNLRLHSFYETNKKSFAGCAEFVHQIYKKFNRHIGGPLPGDFESNENKKIEFTSEPEDWHKLLSISLLTGEIMKMLRVASSSSTTS